MKETDRMKGALQNVFTDTISPASIARLRESTVFAEFMKCFRRDCGVFVETHDKVNTFLKHFEVVRKELGDRKLLINFIGRIRFHLKIRDYKLTEVLVIYKKM